MGEEMAKEEKVKISRSTVDVYNYTIASEMT